MDEVIQRELKASNPQELENRVIFNDKTKEFEEVRTNYSPSLIVNASIEGRIGIVKKNKV